jgi:hypothetical protein
MYESSRTTYNVQNAAPEAAEFSDNSVGLDVHHANNHIVTYYC